MVADSQSHHLKGKAMTTATPLEHTVDHMVDLFMNGEIKEFNDCVNVVTNAKLAKVLRAIAARKA